MKVFRLIISFGLLILVIAGCADSLDLLNDPRKGDIYIFEEKEIYFPVKVDHVSGDSVFCVNSLYRFADAVPEPEDLPENEFDYGFWLIYQKEELIRLSSEKKLIRVYRK